MKEPNDQQAPQDLPWSENSSSPEKQQDSQSFSVEEQQPEQNYPSNLSSDQAANQQVPPPPPYSPYQNTYQQVNQPQYQQTPPGVPPAANQQQPPYGGQVCGGQTQNQGTPGYQPGYQQIPYGGQYQGYPQTPYSNQPPYQEPQKKSKVWPWVLGGCLIFFILGLGGCVGCVTCSALLSENASLSNNDTYDYYFDPEEEFNNNYDNDDYFDDTYTLKELKEIAADKPSTISDGQCSTGLFEVGSGKDIAAGLYYLEGSQTEEGSFVIFNKNSTGADYSIRVPVSYFGNYFADLQEGDVVLFLSPENAHMYQADKATLNPGDMIESGCYRVGIDIPAGTYKVTAQANTPEDISQEAGAYIMKDLAWNEGSILKSYALLVGGSHTITVEEGQYLELYLGTMTPVSE